MSHPHLGLSSVSRRRITTSRTPDHPRSAIRGRGPGGSAGGRSTGRSWSAPVDQERLLGRGIGRSGVDRRVFAGRACTEDRHGQQWRHRGAGLTGRGQRLGSHRSHRGRGAVIAGDVESQVADQCARDRGAQACGLITAHVRGSNHCCRWSHHGRPKRTGRRLVVSARRPSSGLKPTSTRP